MALGANSFEDLGPVLRVAQVVAEELTHLGNDFLALGVSFLANGTPRFFDGPDRLPVVAFHNFPQMIGVEHFRRSRFSRTALSSFRVQDCRSSNNSIASGFNSGANFGYAVSSKSATFGSG